MSLAIPSPVKITKNNVEYISKVERSKYLLEELIRAALKDVGKLIVNRIRQKIKRRTGRLAKNIQFWVRKQSGDLQIGIKPGGFYGGFQELGTSKQPKIGALSETVQENIDEIRRIEGEYIQAIEDENRALGLIDESEGIGGDE